VDGLGRAYTQKAGHCRRKEINYGLGPSKWDLRYPNTQRASTLERAEEGYTDVDQEINRTES
jgi:hypothetical protein